MDDQEAVKQVLEDAKNAQEANPQSGPQEPLNFDVSAHLKGGEDLVESMMVPVPAGFKNYPLAALTVADGIMKQGGFMRKIDAETFEFYPLDRIEKFSIRFQPSKLIVLPNPGGIVRP